MENTKAIPTFLGLTQREIERFSIVRAVTAIEADPVARHGADFEFECDAEIAKRLGVPARPGYIYVPLEVQQRTLQVGTAALGGYLVGAPSYVPGASFAEALRAQDPLAAFGIGTVGPMVGNFAMPTVSTAPAASWLTELGTATDSPPPYGQQIATPKTVASFYTVSRPLLKSAPPPVLDALVVSESARTIAAARAAAFIAGAGTGGEPKGIANVTGVFSQSGSALAYAGILNMAEAVEGAGLADPRRAGFVLGKTAAKLMRTRERQAGAGAILDGFEIAGYRAVVTAACPADAIVFGDWSRAALGEWGILEAGADPFTAFQSGTVSVRAIYSCDVLCMQPTAFGKATSVT